MDTGPVEPRSVGTKGTRTLVAVGLFFLVGAIVVIAALVIGGIRKAVPEVKKDWNYLSQVRSNDAAVVEAQRKAGEAYKGKVKIEMKATVGELEAKGYRATLTGTVTNTGTGVVLKVISPVVFRAANGTKADNRDLTLLNAVSLSSTTDSPLGPGNSVSFTIPLDGIGTDWDKKTIDAAVGEVRVDAANADIDTTATQ